MRVCRKLDRPLVLTLCLFALTLIIVFKSSQDIKLVVDSKSDVKSSEPSLINNRLDELTTASKWKVLKDGTVIHLGNFSSSFNYSYLINNENICKKFVSKSLKIIIFVESEAINFERRQLIRETWGLKLLQQAINYRIVFLLGLHHDTVKAAKIQEKIQREDLTYGDIIQLDFVESFKNLTLKSVLSLRWYLQFCPEADFSFKTDDDIYIHTPNLFKAFERFNNKNNSILCHENKTRKIIRSYEDVSQIMRRYRQSLKRREIVNYLKKKISKYIVSFSQLSGIYYPHYCAGFGYGFSLNVAKRLYEAALTIPYFLIEDVFITGFCRQKAGLHITDSQLLNLKPVLSPKQGICAFNSGRINANEMSIEQIRELWININTEGFFCPKLVNVNKTGLHFTQN